VVVAGSSWRQAGVVTLAAREFEKWVAQRLAVANLRQESGGDLRSAGGGGNAGCADYSECQADGLSSCCPSQSWRLECRAMVVTSVNSHIDAMNAAIRNHL
jgi:hypothetical protein